MKEYLPIFLQVIVAIGFAAAALIFSVILGKSAKRNKAKDSAYECGMPAVGEAQPRFSVKFYLVAMLFILFDIEIVFMYPWAVIYREYIAHHGADIFLVHAQLRRCAHRGLCLCHHEGRAGLEALNQPARRGCGCGKSFSHSVIATPAYF
ncbi:NADH-ubiquinone/plastoquinone oxidoreductase chain 3 [Chthoniobacter flavus Ellin428]|uniref:NADH-quinone oxidoreductase subunit n=1 Tax=Chthoniobacter flavus Ellin428 TaxID=497964 RepID=B4D6N5_9BACT|nr:NADH-ubiquinone/plastoquinone oxidoreductase chain 3 [Chthoniobacter flavus Ellin428]